MINFFAFFLFPPRLRCFCVMNEWLTYSATRVSNGGSWSTADSSPHQGLINVANQGKCFVVHLDNVLFWKNAHILSHVTSLFRFFTLRDVKYCGWYILYAVLNYYGESALPSSAFVRRFSSGQGMVNSPPMDRQMPRGVLPSRRSRGGTRPGVFPTLRQTQYTCAAVSNRFVSKALTFCLYSRYL